MARGDISPYPLLPFHSIRALALTSIVIVTSVLTYFCIQLKNDGFKLPWTLLIVLLAAILALFHLVLTYLMFCCGRLSPLLNMIVSTPILLLWTVSFGLLVYNMYGTLSHSCNKTNWANEDGMTVCGQYKAFFAFVVIGWLCLVALVIVDVRARKNQSFARYDKMDKQGDADVKLTSLDHSRNASTNDIPYGIDNYRDRSESVNSQNRRQSSPHRHRSGSNLQRYDSPYGNDRHQQHRVDDYWQQPEQPSSYLPQQTTYSPQTHYHQPAYDGMRLR